MDVQAKIQAGYYQSVPEPVKPALLQKDLMSLTSEDLAQFPAVVQEYQKAFVGWYLKKAPLRELRADLEAEWGMTGHPLADRFWDRVYGLSKSPQDIFETYRYWVGLVKSTLNPCVDVSEPSKQVFDFGQGPVPAHQHKNGGGWVADTATVADTAFVGPNAQVYGFAIVRDYAWVSDNAEVYGNAVVRDNARVYDNARAYDKAQVRDEAEVSDQAQVYGTAWVYSNARVYGNAWVEGTAKVRSNAQVYGEALVKDKSVVKDRAQVYGDAVVCGDTCVGGEAWVYGDAVLLGGNWSEGLISAGRWQAPGKPE